jgi:hypothetical protein
MIKIAKYLIPSGLLCCILFSSCLKDKPYMDVSNTAPIIEFGLSPTSGYSGIFKFKGDTAGASVTDTAIGLVIASPQVLNESVTVNFALNQSQIDAYNNDGDPNHADDYIMLPSAYYTLTSTTVNIASQHRVGRIPVVFNFPAMPAHHHYAFPLSIQNAKGASGDSLIVSGNSAQFMFVFTR